MASRSSGFSTTLRAPGRFEVRSVQPSGDCFYDCLDMQLPRGGRRSGLETAEAMRDTIADTMDEDLLALYRMYGEAGVEGYEFMRHHRAPTNLLELREFARRRGHTAGAGQCLWADEHALQTMSRLADILILIVDEQATSRGSRSGRRRGDNDAGVDGRFVSVGEASRRCLLLHRSRRQHFSPCFLDGHGVFDVDALPTQTRELWPLLKAAERLALDVEACDAKHAKHAKRRRRAEPEADAPPTAETSALSRVAEMFPGVDSEIISDTLLSCGGNEERAVAHLVEMS